MLLDKILERKKEGRKSLSILIDPDTFNTSQSDSRIDLAVKNDIDFFFVGGSLVNGNEIDAVVTSIKRKCNIPVILFPGSPLQLSSKVDAILFLSLLSGRNPEYLIGNHVIAAPYLSKLKTEVLSTAYLLIDGGKATTASYISNSSPIPRNKAQIAQATALAGKYLGFSLTYLDAGSGAEQSIAPEMIASVSEVIDSPLIVGGGIKSAKDLESIYDAGADVAVVGNAIEADFGLIEKLAAVKNRF